jgi:FlaG/FlaF family flagellin (archaellin)
MLYNKKALGPVVATALFIVIAVASIMGFQNWFGLYQSNIEVEVEQQATVSEFFRVDALILEIIYIYIQGLIIICQF